MAASNVEEKLNDLGSTCQVGGGASGHPPGSFLAHLRHILIYDTRTWKMLHRIECKACGIFETKRSVLEMYTLENEHGT